MEFISKIVDPAFYALEEKRIQLNWGEYSKGSNLDETVVEPLILPLVRILNKKGDNVATIASCQGHFFSRRMPYIYFQAPFLVAKSLASALWEVQHYSNQLSLPWELRPRFNAQFDICFCLGVPATYKFARPCLSNAKQWRKKIENDFYCISQLYEKLFNETGKAVT